MVTVREAPLDVVREIARGAVGIPETRAKTVSFSPLTETDDGTATRRSSAALRVANELP